MSPPHRHAWAPPLLVGVVAAIAAEVALAVLLYAGPGLVRSLTTILGVEALALAAGLRMPYPDPEPEDGLRRRWLFALVSLFVATLFGTLWAVVQDVGSGRVGQGLGLGLLAGLPLYACGALLGGLSVERARAGDGGGARLAATAAFGAGLGFVLTGLLLPRAPMAASLLVACLILLSLGGMVYGMGVSARTRVRELGGGTGAPEIRVEERRPGDGDAPVRILLEGGCLRAQVPVDDSGVPAWKDGHPALAIESTPWDVIAARATLPTDLGRRRRVLHVGGGASTAPRDTVLRHPAASVVVLERDPTLVQLAARHLGTRLGGTDDGDARAAPLVASGSADPAEESARDRIEVIVGNLEDGIRRAEGPFDLIIVDGRVFEPLGGRTALSREGYRALLERLAPDGVLAWGPAGVHHPTMPLGERWRASRFFRSAPGEDVLIASRTETLAISAPALPGGFVRVGEPEGPVLIESEEAGSEPPPSTPEDGGSGPRPDGPEGAGGPPGDALARP